MIPLALDPRHAKIALAGNGVLALRRLRALVQAGATGLPVYADAPEPELAAAAGAQLRRTLPDEAALSELQLLWIADLAPDTAQELAATARRLRVLVNLEDVPAYCDFHSVAEIRRGDFLLTVSTHGAAPGLASAVRRRLEACFAPEWAQRVDEIKALRQGWRADGVSMAEAASRIDAIVEQRCWLPCPRPN